MKATELMIGDWVVNPAHNDIAKIEGIYYDKELHCFVGTDGRFPQEYYEPITLTEEILKANGFRSAEYDLFMHKDTSVHFRIGNDTYIDVFGIDDGQPLLCCQYVHELQHALRMCGLNELADNFKLE